MAKNKKKHQVVVRTEACKGCDLCVEFCKPEVLRTSESLNKMGYNYAEVVADKECNGCMICTLVCPDLVLEVYYE
ncbi:MAG: 4Fe-4S dicluster domain-containing protein [SAR324 cluster bacterium]|nr:4Fe-4S dicluster domain-containing protein [SAR324 cluster bacterium]